MPRLDKRVNAALVFGPTRKSYSLGWYQGYRLPCVPMASRNGETDTLPMEVQAFVHDKDSATYLRCEDLNGDGRRYYLLMIQETKEVETNLGTSQITDKLTIQILLRQPNGELLSVVCRHG